MGEDLLTEGNPNEPISRREMTLIIKSLRSDLKLLVFLSIAANQALFHVSLPSSVTVGSLIAVAAKLVFFR